MDSTLHRLPPDEYPNSLGDADIVAFLSALAIDRHVAASTQNQVLSAILFRALLEALTGTAKLVATLLYGAGLRLSECLDLRVKDLDLERRELVVRHGKGGKDRITMIPASIVPALRVHLDEVKASSPYN